MWKDAFWLSKKEVRYNIGPICFTFLGVVFLALLSSFMLYVSEPGESRVFLDSFILDIFFVGLTPSFAVLFISGPYLSFRTIREDPYSKRMAFYRLLPISIRTLALSRTLFMLIIFAIMSAAFYITLYFLIRSFEFFPLNSEQFLYFTFFWIGFALAFAGFNLFIEVGTSGKMLHTIPYLYMLILVIIHFIFRWQIDMGMVEASILLIQNHNWLPTLMSLIIGVLGCYLWYRLLQRRLAKRDYV